MEKQLNYEEMYRKAKDAYDDLKDQYLSLQVKYNNQFDKAVNWKAVSEFISDKRFIRGYITGLLVLAFLIAVFDRRY